MSLFKNIRTGGTYQCVTKNCVERTLVLRDMELNREFSLTLSDNVPMTKERLLQLLHDLKDSRDPEKTHGIIDDLLLSFINDPEVTAAVHKCTRWYS